MTWNYPAGNYMFKVNNRNTRTRCEIYSKLALNTPEWHCIFDSFNDTCREKLVLYSIQYKNLLNYKGGCFWYFSYVFTINQVLLFPLSYRCLKKVIHQIDSKNLWLLLSGTFTAKFELVFVLTFENAFS